MWLWSWILVGYSIILDMSWVLIGKDNLCCWMDDFFWFKSCCMVLLWILSRCHIDIFWCYLILFGYDHFLPTTQDSFISKVRRFAKKISNNMTWSRASKSAACQKHDFCLKKVHRSSLAFLFFFSGKKNPWDVTGNLDLYVYIYIYGFWFTSFLRKMNCCFVSFGAMISLQIDGCCWLFFNRKGLRRKGLFFVFHMIQDAVIGCHSSSGVNQAFVSNRCSSTNQIFKNKYVTFPIYMYIYSLMSILWKLEIGVFMLCFTNIDIVLVIYIA